MTTPYDENGFLHGRIEAWIRDHRRDFFSVFAEGEALNRHCHEFLDGRSIDLGDKRQLVTSVLFARLLELFQSAIVLAEKGFSTPVRIIFRAFLEVSFHHAAIHIDPEYLDDYLNQFYVQRKKLVNRLRNTTSPSLESIRQDLDEPIVSEINKTINDKGVRRLSIEDVARRAQHHDTYVTVYSDLSRAVHTSASDLESHLRLSEDTEEITGFGYGPSSRETSRVISLMGMSLAESLAQISQTFGEDRNDLCGLHKDRFQQLLPDVNSEESV